jgi:hypothetical protein
MLPGDERALFARLSSWALSSAISRSLARMTARSEPWSCCQLTNDQLRAYNILLGLGLDLGAAAGELERLERLCTVVLLGRHGANDTDVRVTAQDILKKVRELRVAVRDVAALPGVGQLVHDLTEGKQAGVSFNETQQLTSG